MVETGLYSVFHMGAVASEEAYMDRELVSRISARSASIMFYFTGVPCHAGHVTERRTSTGACHECEKGYGRKYGKANRPKRNTNCYAWRRSNPARSREIARQSKNKHGRKHALRHKFNMTPAQYDAMVASQQGKCALCRGIPSESNPLVIDHSRGCCSGTRSCGKCIRGLIHRNCNFAIGLFNDNPDIIRLAAKYIETFNNHPTVNASVVTRA